MKTLGQVAMDAYWQRKGPQSGEESWESSAAAVVAAYEVQRSSQIEITKEEAELVALCLHAEARQWQDLFRDHGHRMCAEAIKHQTERVGRILELAARIDFRLSAKEPLCS